MLIKNDFIENVLRNKKAVIIQNYSLIHSYQGMPYTELCEQSKYI